MESNKKKPLGLWRHRLQDPGQELVKEILFDNLAYKLVSLFVALVLWLAILGRRDFVATQEVEVLFTPAKGRSVISQSADRVRLKLSGPQATIKRQRARLSSIMIDVSQLTEGVHDVDVAVQNLDLPSGIKALSIKPNVVKIEISSQ